MSSFDSNHPAGDDDVAADELGQHDAARINCGQHDREEAPVERMKTGVLVLPYIKQGDDLCNYLKDNGNVVEAIEGHACQMHLAAVKLRAVKEIVAGRDIKVVASGHLIFVTGPVDLLDNLIAEGLLQEEGPNGDEDAESTEMTRDVAEEIEQDMYFFIEQHVVAGFLGPDEIVTDITKSFAQDCA